MELIGTNDYSQLQISGKKDLVKCGEVWEEIVKMNAEKNKDFQFESFIEMQKCSKKYSADYVEIKALLTKLALPLISKNQFPIDHDAVKRLKRLGYNIVADQTWGIYEKSLMNALRRSDNLITKTKMKENEIKDFILNNRKGKAANISLEEVLGHLSAGLGYSVDQSITLSRYNIYKEILKAKNGRQRGNKQAGRTT